MNLRQSRMLGIWCVFLIVGCGAQHFEATENGQSSLVAGGTAAIANSGQEVDLDEHGQVRSRVIRRLVPAVASVLEPKPAEPRIIVAPLTTKVQGKLRGLIDRAGRGVKLEVAVAVKEETPFSPLPAIDESLPRDSAINLAKLAERQAAFEAMAAPRRTALRRWANRIRQAGGEVIGEYEIGSTVTARMPAEAIDVFAADSDVHQISSRIGDSPPADTISGNDTIKARALVGTDPFVTAGYVGSWGWVGLLDTGVRTSHAMLQEPSPIILESDCFRGGPTCRDSTAPGYSTTDTYGHGTSSAAIISGTVNLGGNWRGVTAQQKIDSWKISDDLGGTNIDAVLAAYKRVTVWSEWAVAAVIQIDQPPNGSVANGANDLYDLGVAVFGSNGNFSGLSRSPANANKAIGVGGYDVVSSANYDHNVGTPDGRFKPDLRTPTGVETASAKSASGASLCDTCMKVFGGTSCAAPMAVGTASLLRDYFINNGLSSVPGNIYAGLIAFGSESPNATNGSGRTKLAPPTCSRYSVGQVTLSQGQVVEISHTVAAGGSNLKAGIWWPTQYQSHRDIDLHVYNPSGGFVFGSNGTPSVFERVQVDGALQSGTWKIKITGFTIPFGTQQVFYVIHNKSC